MARKTKTPPTPEDRIASAIALKESALDVFRNAARDIEFSAEAHAQVAAELDSEIERLIQLQRQADEETDKARDQAATIRELFI